MDIKVQKIIKFEKLYEANLIVNMVYEGGKNGNHSDEVMVLCQYLGHKKSNFFMLHF
ncbi:MAG: hypothetical protein HUJ77_12445 [Clostridium sp.]|uniref:hypothetical protein n=1 Tax=Clostridium sp. TaxID=1506 RepID=UPI0025C4EB96|nr:hypothetical protein [Clostridium sp.]MCF0149192.1 hypothetical protein [Clostridium sp.]